MLPMMPGSVVGRASPAQGFGAGQFSAVDERRDGDHRPLALAWRGRRERFVERRRRVSRVQDARRREAPLPVGRGRHGEEIAAARRSQGGCGCCDAKEERGARAGHVVSQRVALVTACRRRDEQLPLALLSVALMRPWLIACPVSQTAFDAAQSSRAAALILVVMQTAHDCR